MVKKYFDDMIWPSFLPLLQLDDECEYSKEFSFISEFSSGIYFSAFCFKWQLLF